MRSAATAYNPVRGARVVAYGREFLDQYFPLSGASHRDATAYQVQARPAHGGDRGPGRRACATASAFVGYPGRRRRPDAGVAAPSRSARRNPHRSRASGRAGGDAAGVSDLVLESALSTIQDLEDSVAAVDADDKIAAYRNWLGLMRGTLEARLPKAGGELTRRLQSGSALPGAGRRRAGAAGAQSHAGAQRRAPHDERDGAHRRSGRCPRPCSMRPAAP